MEWTEDDQKIVDSYVSRYGAVLRVIEILEAAPRQGTAIDEPEGARFITISDTLALKLAAAMR